MCSVLQHRCTAAQGPGKLHVPLLLCKIGSQQAVCHCSYTYGNLLFIHVYRDPRPMHCSTGSGQHACSTAQCCFANQAHSRQYVIANTPMEKRLFIQVFSADSPMHCSIGSGQKCMFHCSALLCKTGSKQAVCHCSYTYGDLLFIQVYKDPTPMHCSTGSGQNAFFTAQCCFAKQAHSRHCDITVTPMETCSSYTCTETQDQCTAALGQGNMHVPLLSAALQNRLTAGSVSLQIHLWRKGSSYRCSVLTHQCTAALGQGKIHVPLLSAALQNRLTAGTVSLQLHLWRFALHAGVQRPKTNALQHWVRAKCIFHYSVLLCKTGSQQALCHCSYT